MKQKPLISLREETHSEPMHLVFDIGANLGNTVEKFLQKAERVIAFEPNPALLDQLRQRHDTQRVTLDGRAISDSIGTSIMHLSPAHTISTLSSEWVQDSRFSHTHTWNQDIQVVTTTLDQILSEYGIPDYIKIDVEGHEEQVFLGLTQLLPHTILAFEWAEEMQDSIGRTLTRLQELGYTRFHWSDGDHILYDEQIDWVTDPWVYHQALDPRRKTQWGMIYTKA